MKNIVVGIGEYRISDDPEAVIKTFALGSCVAVIMYDIARRMGGMVHIALPDSSIDGKKAAALPGYFADTGLPALIDTMSYFGSIRQNLCVKVAGGANINNSDFTFDIGKRNLLAVKKILWRYNMYAQSADVGGSISRTVSVSVNTGIVNITSNSKVWEI